MSDENNLFSILMTQEPLTAEEKEALEGIEKRLETFGDAAASVDFLCTSIWVKHSVFAL